MARRRRRSGAAAAAALLAVWTVAPEAAADRPPLYTDQGMGVLKRWAADAANLSDAALPELIDLIADSGAEAACVGLPCEGASPHELVSAIVWEFLNAMPLVHNGPLTEGNQSSDENGLFSNLDGGWIENVWQRVVEGKAHFNSFEDPSYNCYEVETKYLGFPPFNESSMGKHPPGINAPTWQEANTRPLYLAGNIWKKSIGSSIFGDAMYVMSRSVWDRILISPFDTGRYALNDSTPTGLQQTSRPGVLLGHGPEQGPWQNRANLTGFIHVIVDHINFYKVQRNFDVGEWFKHWYGPQCPNCSRPPALDQPYQIFEPNIVGTAWLPEHLLYVSARFSGTWGTTFAGRLRDVMTGKGRPLLWADGDTSGLLLDPVVGQVGDESVEEGSTIVQPGMVAAFKQRCKTPGLTFPELYNSTTRALQVHHISYYTRDVCARAFACPDCEIVGVNAEGRCVFWRWQKSRDGPRPEQKRCCVEGRCLPCADGVAFDHCARHCHPPVAGGDDEGGFPIGAFAAIGGAALMFTACGMLLRCCRARRGSEDRRSLLSGPSNPASSRPTTPGCGSAGGPRASPRTLGASGTWRGNPPVFLPVNNTALQHGANALKNEERCGTWPPRRSRHSPNGSASPQQRGGVSPAPENDVLDAVRGGSLYGELRPGSWTMRLDAGGQPMRLDVRVYPEAAYPEVVSGPPSLRPAGPPSERSRQPSPKSATAAGAAARLPAFASPRLDTPRAEAPATPTSANGPPPLPPGVQPIQSTGSPPGPREDPHTPPPLLTPVGRVVAPPCLRCKRPTGPVSEQFVRRHGELRVRCDRCNLRVFVRTMNSAGFTHCHACNHSLCAPCARHCSVASPHPPPPPKPPPPGQPPLHRGTPTTGTPTPGPAR